MTKLSTLESNPIEEGTGVPYWYDGNIMWADLPSLIDENVVGRTRADPEADDVAVAMFARSADCPFLTNDKFRWRGGANADLRRWLERHQHLQARKTKTPPFRL